MTPTENSTPKTKNYSSLLAWLLCCAMLIGAACWYPKWSNPGTEATISWDVSGYYWYLPAFLIYKDPLKMEFREEIIKKYKPTWDFHQAYPHGEGFVMKYSMGMALQYLPFFAAGHLWASVSDYPADGFSFPYQAMLHWGSLLVAFLGLWLTRLSLRRYFRDEVAAIVLLLIGIGTNYLNYASIDAALTHNYQFTLFALLIWTTIRWHERPSRAGAIGAGALLGLIALTRPSDLVVALIPLAWGWDGLKGRLAFWRKHIPELALAVAAAALVGFLQMAYWKFAAGEWLVYSYQDQGFSFLRPHLADVLISYKKGWLVYTPVMVFALAGFIFLWGKKDLFWPLLAFFLLNFWIVSAWDIWWYGGSFGQRALIQSYAALVFPLAAFAAWAWERKWRMAAFVPAALFCIALNLFQTWQAHFGGLDPELMNRAYYWQTFFKTSVDPKDQLLLDSNERPFRRKEEVRTAFFTDFERPGADSAQISQDTAFSGALSLKVEPLSSSISYVIGGDFQGASGIRLSGWFFGYKKEWDVWRMGQLHVAWLNKGETIKDGLIRVPRLMESGKWVEIGADFRFPRKPFDEIRIYFYNPSEVKTVYIDDLKAEFFRGE